MNNGQPGAKLPRKLLDRPRARASVGPFRKASHVGWDRQRAAVAAASGVQGGPGNTDG